MIPHSITDKSISVLIDFQMRVVPASSINFGAIRDLLRSKKDDAATLKRLKQMVDIPTFVAKVSVGRIRIGADEVFFKDAQVGGYAATRLLQHLEAGDPIEPLCRLLDKLMENPESSIREDLWKWMEAAQLPIAEDGDIVAFKKVQHDYTSYHADTKGRKFDHHIGNKPSMPRADCDKNRHNSCSTGLHFCSYSYLPGYFGNQGRVVIVKINPANITSFPTDGEQKGRCCLYEVVGEIAEAEAAKFFSGNVVSRVGTYQKPKHETEVDWENVEEDDSIGVEPEDEGDDGVDVTEIVEKSDYVVQQERELGVTFTKIAPPDRVKISGKTFQTQRVLDMVASIGQRGAAKKLGVPRSSLQDTIKRLT